MQTMVYECRPLTVTANVSVRKGVALLIEAWSKAGLRDAEIARWFLDVFLTPSPDICHSASTGFRQAPCATLTDVFTPIFLSGLRGR